jgi:hypothetical protein
MFLFAIKFCIFNNYFSNEYTKFRITYYEIGFFKKSFRFVDFLSSKKLSNLLFCSKFRLNSHRYHIFLKKILERYKKLIFSVLSNSICISPIHTFVNIPALIRKRSVFLSSRAGIFTKL